MAARKSKAASEGGGKISLPGGTAKRVSRGRAKKTSGGTPKRNTNRVLGGREGAVAARAVRRAGGPGKTLFDRFDPLGGRMLAVLDERGRVIDEEDFPAVAPEKIVEAYRIMVLARVSDEKALSWQRQGRLYTFPPNKGQEAAAVGSAMALEKGDWMVPAFRELGAWLVHGAPLVNFFLQFGGNEKGSVFPPGVRILPHAVPIASQLPHAAGIGYGIAYRGEKEIVIAYFGDGATSQGDFHEAMNLAGVWKAPVVFFCNNNQYAISVPRSMQTASATLAQKAVAYGVPGIQVDGNDFFAVYAAVREAAERARSGRGPSLVEAVTYRLGAHTTSDDPGRYRTAAEEEEWARKDPLDRLRIYLEERGLWDDAGEEAERAAAAQAAEAAFAEYEAVTDYPVKDVFAHHFARMPPELARQKAEYEKFLEWKEDL